MNFGKKYENAYTCSFFGDTKEKDITVDMLYVLYGYLEWLADERNVKIFYTTSVTDFDFICEAMVLYLQHKYPDILLVKYASQKYKRKPSDDRYNYVINYESSDYRKRCSYVGEISDYAIFDNLNGLGPKSDAFMGHTINGYYNGNHKKDGYHIVLSRIVERARKRHMKEREKVSVHTHESADGEVNETNSSIPEL